MQIYHSNAATNINIRCEIQNNSGTNLELATRFNTSEQTISKWRNRDFVQDKSCKPLNIKYALNELEKAIIISLRKSSWMPLDEVWETVLETNPSVSRSSVHRCFVAENINKVPVEKKEIVKKFKDPSP
jgi:predicted transcriptional regulator